MKRTHGFTLIELMVTVAMIAIVAAIAIPTMRAATRNANVNGVSFDLLLRLQGLKPKALADQRTYVAVFVDAPGNDGTGCVFGAAGRCARLIVLRNPTSDWKLEDFDPASPGTNAQLEERMELGRGIRFATEKAGRAGPAPFSAITSLAPGAIAACAEPARSCMAVRFNPDGTVFVEAPGGTDRTMRGIALVLGSEMAQLSRGAEARAILIAAPSGIVKAFGL